MKRISSIIFIAILIVITACSEDNPTESEQPQAEYTISGKVTDINGNPFEGIQLKLTLDTSTDEVELSTSTDASGYYEIVNNLQEYTGWYLEIISSEHEFTSNQSTNGVEKFDSNLVINFEKNEDYVQKWIADSTGLPESALVDAKSSIINIVDNETLYWWQYDSNSNVISSLSSRSLSATRSASGNIHQIRVPGRDNSGNLIFDYRGIFRIDKSQTQWKLTIEILDILENGNTAPTVEGGFGSANGGADGNAYVWNFIESKDN